MSKKCPYCDSYNTEVNYGTQVVRGIANTGTFIASLGVGALASLAGPFHGGHVAKEVHEKLDTGDWDTWHCCNCGRDFCPKKAK